MVGGKIVRAGMGSVTVARMRLPGAFAAAASLLLSAALLLAPGQARAVNECGTLSGTPPTATCTATSYANGIQYLSVSGGTVIVPGAATAWTVTSGTGNWGSGIVLDTNNPGAGDTTARNIALTVGGASDTANQVAIAQRGSTTNSGDNNNGIRVNQQGRGTSTTTVTVHGGVTIGGTTWAERMNRRGIDTRVYLTSGAASVTNAANIYSTWSAIHLERHQSADTTADTTITNSGDLTALAPVIEMLYRAGDTAANNGNGNAKITNTGALVKHTSGFHGAIELEYRGTGNAEVDNQGTVTATHDRASTPVALTSGYGIRLRYLPNLEETTVTGSGTATIRNTQAVMSVNDALRLMNEGFGAATIENSGALTVTGTTGDRRGIYLEDRGTTAAAATAVATVTSSGDIGANDGIIVYVHNKNTAGDNVGVSITHSGGAIVASGGAGIKGAIGDNDDMAANNAGDIAIAVTGGSVRSGGTILEAAQWQAGDIDIRVSDGVTLTSDNQHGIFADMKNVAGSVTISNAGAITTPKTGIFVRREASTGAGPISVTNSGPIRKTGDPNWMAILVEDKGAGDVTVTNSGAIGGDGATAMHEHGVRVDKQDGASGGVTVVSSGDVVVAQRGILINVNDGLARIDVTGGSFDVGNTIVEAKNLGTGNVDIDVAENVMLTSSEQHGVFAELGEDNTTGGIDVDNKGTITTPKTGIYVRRQAPTGTGAISVANSGHIKKTGETNWFGILINDKGTGSVTVANSGNIGEANARHGTGILAEKTGASGDVTITSSGGAVMSGGRGLFALVGESGGDPLTKTGNARIAVTGGSVTTGGVAVEAKNFSEAGNIDIDVAEGVTLISERDHGIFAEVTSHNATGTVSIDQAGPITTPKTGIYVRRCEDDYGCGSNGAIRITNSGAIRKSSDSSWMGIFVAEKGLGPVTVTNSGDISGTGGDNIHDHGILVQGGHEGNDRAEAFTVTNSGDLTAALFGIWVPVKEADRRIVIRQGGAVTARKGIHVQAGRTGAEGETRRAEDQPLIDIAWTGGAFSHGTETAADDVDKLGAGSVAGALDVNLQYVTHETILRQGPAVGIEAQVMTWHYVAQEVAKGDDPGEIADATAQTALLGDASRRDAVVRHFRAALATEVNIPDAVFADIKTGATSVDDITDAEIVTYLRTDDDDTRTLLRNILAQSLSEAEAAVLRAVTTDADLDAALTAAGFTDDAADDGDYWSRVKALRDRRNVGNIAIAMTGGSIASRGDGIRAYYATPNADNGAIDVTVAEDAKVTGGNAGIWVSNAGLGNVGTATSRGRSLLLRSDEENLRQQFVTVHGEVTGGTDAAVHLSGGGALVVGRTGKLFAGSSGRAILVNNPGRAIIVIHGEVWGDDDGRAAVDMTGGGMVTVGPTGSVDANGADNAIRAAGGVTEVLLAYGEGQGDAQGPYRDHVGGQVSGSITSPENDGVRHDNGGVFYAAADSDGMTGMRSSDPLPLNADGTLDVTGLPQRPCPEEGQVRGDDGQCMTPPPDEPRQPMMPDEPRQPMTPDEPQQPVMTLDCDLASDNRCRLYEALPSALLAMNGLPTYAERASAARDAGRGWARVEGASGKWKAEASTRPDVAYDHRRYGVRAGVDFLAGGTGRLGLSVHNARGSAEMASVGKIETTGSGVGAHATMLADGFHVDVQAAMTWYDVDLKSALRGRLKDNVGGRGYAVGVEAGRRMSAAVDGVSLTPRAGLVWSKVSLDDFTEEMAVGVGARVSVADAQSLKARAGVAAEAGDADGRLFGSLDVEQEFSAETEAKASGTSLKASAGKTGVRIGMGGSFALGRNALLQGSANYAVGTGGNRDFGAGLNLAVRF